LVIKSKSIGMKKLVLLSAAILFSGLVSFAQDGTNTWYSNDNSSEPGDAPFEYVVRARYKVPVTKQTLEKANTLSDFIAEYPGNWVSDYISVEIATTTSGRTVKAVSANGLLTTEQKNILISADHGTNIAVNVNYRTKNAATAKNETRSMNMSMTVIPEVQAEYVGGHKRSLQYMEKAVQKISETVVAPVDEVAVVFTVQETGAITDAKILRTSGNTKTDKLLLDAISNMPKWKPAENAQGVKVKQEFEFAIFNRGC
jgi:TonB family protein